MCLFLLGLQGCYRLAESSYFLLGVALLLALHGNHLLWGILHKALVLQFLRDTRKESLKMLQLSLKFLDFGADVN